MHRARLQTQTPRTHGSSLKLQGALLDTGAAGATQCNAKQSTVHSAHTCQIIPCRSNGSSFHLQYGTHALPPPSRTTTLPPSPSDALSDALSIFPGGALYQLGLLPLAGRPTCHHPNEWGVPSLQVAHHTVGGCSLRPGDVLGTGTISGPNPGKE